MKPHNRKNAALYFYKLMEQEEKTSFEKHIKRCSDCQLFLRRLEKTQKIYSSLKLKQLKLPPLDAVLREARLKEMSEEQKRPWLWEILWEVRKPAYILSFSFLFLIAIGIFILTLAKGGEEDFGGLVLESPEESQVRKDTALKKLPSQKIYVKAKPSKRIRSEKGETWELPGKAPLRENPSYNNGIVYFGSDDKQVYAMDSETGEILWKFPTGGRISSPPVPYKDYIYAASTDGSLYKINSDGKHIWKKEVGLLVQSRFAIDTRGIYLCNNQGLISALAHDGSIIWEHPCDEKVYSPLVQDQKSVFIPTWDGVVVALNKEKGSINWKQKIGSHFLTSTPLLLEEQIILGDTDGMLVSLDKKSGDVKWGYQTQEQIVSSPVSYKNRIYLASDKLYCLSARGKKIWEYEPATVVGLNLSIVQNKVTMVDKNNTLYFVHTESGRCFKKISSENSLLSILYANNRIYAGTQNGNLFVLK